MLSDWIHWLSSKRPDELLLLMLPWLLLDTPRYGLGSIAVCFGDAFKSALPRNMRNDNKRYHRPLVCAILAGLNEAETVGATLESVLGSYPNLEVIVVDDGSTDGMSNVARQIAIAHENVIVLRKPQRGGKSSALNFALPFTKAEIIVCVDTDLDVWINRDGDSLCYNGTQRRELQQNNNKQGALRDDLVTPILEDAKEGPYNFTRCRMRYLVMNIGPVYVDMAQENSGTALDMMESVVQLAIDVRINAGDFDDWLSSQAVQTSVVGKEVDTWTKDPNSANNNQVVVVASLGLDPGPLHSLRVGGIALLILTLLFWVLLCRRSAERRKEREWDLVYKVRGRGGLGTEEGLDFMLQVGRQESQQLQAPPPPETGTTPGDSRDNDNNDDKDDDDDENVKVPLPGYMDMYSTVPPSVHNSRMS